MWSTDQLADSSSVFVFICPMHKQLYLFLFVMVQVWTIFIHDGDMISGSWWEKYINSPAHHTLHHLYFTCNYGQVSLIPTHLLCYDQRLILFIVLYMGRLVL